MAAVAPTDGRDELDRILDYDDAVEDFLKDIPLGDANQGDSTTTAAREVRDEDQEVQVKRKRNPIPKLDENRLLSDAGIVKLRKVAKTRLKFKGKGHEFSDMSRLLNTYQLWLDDLYPRAKFRDGLNMIEKVGHSKRMQIMRKAWLDETKASNRESSVDREPNATKDGNAPHRSHGETSRDEDLFADMMQEENQSHVTRHGQDGRTPDEDELDALLADHDAMTQAHRTNLISEPGDSGGADGGPNEDELNALLAESSAPSATEKQKQKGPFLTADSDDDDELDALLAEQETHPKTGAGPQGITRSHHRQTSAGYEDEFAAEEEAMADMGDMW